MNKQTREYKFLIGEMLYLDGSMNQKEIASFLSTTQRTVSKWVKNFHWKGKRKNYDRLLNDIVTNTVIYMKGIYELAQSENRPLNTYETDRMAKLHKVVTQINPCVSYPLTLEVLSNLSNFIVINYPDLSDIIDTIKREFLVELGNERITRLNFDLNERTLKTGGTTKKERSVPINEL